MGYFVGVPRILDDSGPAGTRASAGSISRAAGSIGEGKYRVFANLGRGGMADVFLGRPRGPKGFNKLVVVKRLRPQLADDPRS